MGNKAAGDLSALNKTKKKRYDICVIRAIHVFNIFQLT